MNVYRVHLWHPQFTGERRTYTVLGSTPSVACRKAVRAADVSLGQRSRSSFRVVEFVQLSTLVQ